MKRRLPALLLSICFVGLICVPLVSSLMIRDEEMSAAEKRRLAALPELVLSKKSLREYPKEFEKYYNDHFGFRSQIVKLHNYVICSLFKVSPSAAVTVGDDGWYFFNAAAIHDYFGLTKFSDQTLAKFSMVLKDRASWLESLGIRYLFLPVPNKSSVYGEYLPGRVAKSAGPTKYEQVIGYLKRKNDFDNWLDSRAILNEKKSDLQVYFRTDSHWNHDGVYLVYRELIDRLSEWLPGLSPMEMKEEKDWVGKYSGDLSTLMNLRGIITEKAPLVNVRSTCTPRELSRVDRMLQLEQYKKVAKNRLPVENGCENRQYTALLIHDSFGRFLRPLLSQHFKNIIYVNFFNFELIKPLIEHEAVDVVMDLRVSRNLEKALIIDEELEQRVLREQFDQLEGNLMHFAANSWNNFIAGETYKVKSITAEAFPLDNSNGKTFLPLTFDENSGDGPLVMEIDMTSENKTELSVFYLTKKSSQFAETQVEKRQVAVGRQKIYLRILDPEAIGGVRVQPVATGKYLFHSITVKRDRGRRHL